MKGNFTADVENSQEDVAGYRDVVCNLVHCAGPDGFFWLDFSSHHFRGGPRFFFGPYGTFSFSELCKSIVKTGTSDVYCAVSFYKEVSTCSLARCDAKLLVHASCSG